MRAPPRRFTGVYTPKSNEDITWWFTGKGGYKGLSIYMWDDNGGAAWRAASGRSSSPAKPPPSWAS